MRERVKGHNSERQWILLLIIKRVHTNETRWCSSSLCPRTLFSLPSGNGSIHWLEWGCASHLKKFNKMFHPQGCFGYEVFESSKHGKGRERGRGREWKVKDVFKQKIFLVFYFSTSSSRNCWCGLIYNKTITWVRSLFTGGRWSRGRGWSASVLSLCFTWFSDGTFTETVAKATKDHFQMTHATSAGWFSSTSLFTPLKATCFSRWKSASCATLFLEMVRWTTTSATQWMRLAITFAERLGTLRHCSDEEISRSRRENKPTSKSVQRRDPSTHENHKFNDENDDPLLQYVHFYLNTRWPSQRISVHWLRNKFDDLEVRSRGKTRKNELKTVLHLIIKHFRILFSVTLQTSLTSSDLCWRVKVICEA